MNPTYDFSGQVALVTGAGAGMGLETAPRLRRGWCRRRLADVNERALRAASDELTATCHRALGTVIAFAVSRPQSASLSEILIRPTAQAT